MIYRIVLSSSHISGSSFFLAATGAVPPWLQFISLATLVIVGILTWVSTLHRQVREKTAQIKDALEQAEAANRSKSDFLANMSHEIRTPLNGVLGMTEIVLSTELTAEQRDCLVASHYSARNLLCLLNDILDFSKIEAGKLTLESVEFSLATIISKALNTFRALAHEKKIELVTDFDPHLPASVFGDPTRLTQIVTNLVGNAVKFTSMGEVVVEVRMTKRGRPARHELFTVEILVRDSGIGIPKDKIGKLFQSFSQADSSTTRRFGGSGLGLAISARLAAAMGGNIVVESWEGKGSTFTISLNLICGNDIAPSQDVVALQGKTVLIVDDHSINREILQKLLTNLGLKVHAEESAANALEFLEHGSASPDLLITDYQMPGMDGLELLKEVDRRSQAHMPMRRVLLSSGYFPPTADCRVDRTLMKPVLQTELAAALAQLMQPTLVPSETHGLTKLALATTENTVSPDRPGLRVLVAEDNLVNQKLVSRMLERAGHQVTLAGNGVEAIKQAAAARFDVILMDGQMPEMDGLQATQHIRDQEVISGDHLPIIALTAYALKGDRERFLAAGMDDYLTKPIQQRDLMNAIDGVIQSCRRLPQ